MADLEEAVSAARLAYAQGEWPMMSLPERSQVLVRVAQLIRERAYELAKIETQDTGKTTKQTTFIDIPVAANAYEYFAGAAG